MEFRIEMKLEVENGAGDLATWVPITVQVFYRRGRWQAQCIQPPICTVLCDSLPEALVQAAKEASREFCAAPQSD